MGATYYWIDGARFNKYDPQVIGEAIAAIKGKGKKKFPSAEKVVEVARKKSNPLHDLFEWNNTKAAHFYRVEQARLVMRSLSIEYVSRGDTKRVRAFLPVSVSGERMKSWAPAAHAFKCERTREEILREAYQELQSWRRRYQSFMEFAKVVKVIEGLNI